MILGEAGSGKTDLLGRLLEESRQSFHSFSFAYIQPFEDTTRPFGYLLRELIANLSHSVQANQTQLDYIVGRIYRDTIVGQFKTKSMNNRRIQIFIKKLEQNPAILFQKKFFSETNFSKIDRLTLNRLRQKFPNISKTFFKVLLQYRIKSRRPAVISWLGGNIVDRGDAALLRVQDLNSTSDQYLEQRSKDLILDLGKMMSAYSTSIAVCFDRLENMVSETQISALGKLIQFLIDVVPSIIPIVCVRGDGWITRFRHRLNHHVVSRLEDNYFELRGCTPEQSMEMVKSRLNYLLKKSGRDPFFPFEKETLENLFKGKLLSPRRVITLANREMIRLLGEDVEVPQITFFEKLKSAFDGQYYDILTFPYQFQPDRLRLRHGFRLLFQSLLSGQKGRLVKEYTVQHLP